MSPSYFHPLMQLDCLTPSKLSFLLRLSEVYLRKEAIAKHQEQMGCGDCIQFVKTPGWTWSLGKQDSFRIDEKLRCRGKLFLICKVENGLKKTGQLTQKVLPLPLWCSCNITKFTFGEVCSPSPSCLLAHLHLQVKELEQPEAQLY